MSISPSSSKGGALKIALIGPMAAGKSRLSNHLAGQGQTSEEFKYEPTAGVRIFRFDRMLSSGATSVELWDCSGNQQQYETCWPAMMQGLDGCIVVFDPTKESHANEVSIWCQHWSQACQFQTGQIRIFALTEQVDGAAHRPLTVNVDGRNLIIPIANVSLTAPTAASESVAESAFNQFLDGVLSRS